MFTTHFDANVARHRAKLTNRHWGVYFHGTAAPFHEIDFTKVGMGADVNSALGFFVTNELTNAMRYANQVREGQQTGAVLVVALRSQYPYEFENFESFYGADWPEGNPRHGRMHFERMRERLRTAGHDSAWFTLDDDGLIGIALAPEHAIVLAALTLEEAEQLKDTYEIFERYCSPEDKESKEEMLLALSEFFADRAPCVA